MLRLLFSCSCLPTRAQLENALTNPTKEKKTPQRPTKLQSEVSPVLESTNCGSPRSIASLDFTVESDPAITDLNQNVPALSESDLDRIRSEVSESVQPWKDGSFTFVRKLQDADRNQGCVFMMRSSTDGLVAAKRMPNKWTQDGHVNFRKVNPNSSEQPWSDIAIVKYLNDLRSPYVCKFVGVFVDNTTTYVVTSLATEGDLFSWCSFAQDPGPALEKVIRNYVRQIFIAVKQLHEHGIAHRDLSLENIVLTDVGNGDLQIKIIDFGLATLSRRCCGEVRGKLPYQAPEMHLKGAYDTFLSDSFALGVVLFALAAKDYPWHETNPRKCQLFLYFSSLGLKRFLKHRKLRVGNGEHLNDVFSPSLVDIMTGLLALNPEKRITLGESNLADGGSCERRCTVWEMPWLQQLPKL